MKLPLQGQGNISLSRTRLKLTLQPPSTGATNVCELVYVRSHNLGPGGIAAHRRKRMRLVSDLEEMKATRLLVVFESAGTEGNPRDQNHDNHTLGLRHKSSAIRRAY